MPAPAIGKLASARIGPWRAMNEKVSPDRLPPDVLANIQNALLDETPGLVVKRNGNRNVEALPSGLPPRDTYVFTKLDGTSYMLVSDGVTLYYTTDPTIAFPTALITGLNADGLMQFETAENLVWMSNGIDAVMSWDGSTLLLYDRAFESEDNLTTVSTTAFIHAGLGAENDYWNGQQLVFTVGSNVGTTVTVTDYDGGTGQITFTPAVSSIAATDRFIVGVEIPRGADMRYWDGHLFMVSTADNQAEARFHEISDPDTGELITIGNPRAWPAANELALNVLDQERIYGVTPILRDRIMFHKASGLWRLERDPLVVYRLEAVSRSIGSRFPDTWVEKNNLLYFMGQDKDGLPEIYKTDMVDVSLVDPDGGIEPTLRALQQPNATQNSRAFAATPDFDTGTLSTLAATAGGVLAAGAFDTQEQFIDALVSGSNIDLETTPGTVATLGYPVFDNTYDGSVLPQNATPSWNAGSSGNNAASIVDGALRTLNGFPGGAYSAGRTGLLDSTKDVLLVVRVKGTSFIFGVHNGSKAIRYQHDTNVFGTNLIRTTSTTTDTGVAVDSDYHTYHLLLKSSGVTKLWMDGVLIDTSTGSSSAQNLVVFGMFINSHVDDSSLSAGNNQECFYDFVNFHADYKGDQLSTQSGRVSPVTMPATLEASSTIVLLNDHTRAPDSLKRLYHNSTLNGGTVGMESWTSDTEGFTTGTDSAGYLTTAQGAAPASAVKQYQRLRVTLTPSATYEAPYLESLYAGMLWLSPAIQIGQTIASWRTFLSTLDLPSAADQSVMIRRAETTSAPTEAEYGAWFEIANGDNIGTILSDASPTSRWTQLKVEQGVNSDGLAPFVDAMVVQWADGSTAILPIRAVLHKKRYLLTAATAGVDANDIIIVCDRNDQWAKFTGLSLNAMVHYRGNLYGMNAANAYLSLMDIEGSYADYGAAIDAFIETREEDAGMGQLRKNIRYSYLHWDRADAASTLTTYYRRTGDSAYTGGGTFSFGTSGLDVRQNFPVATVGKRIQRKYQNAVLDEGMWFGGESLYFDIRGPQPA